MDLVRRVERALFGAEQYVSERISIDAQRRQSIEDRKRAVESWISSLVAEQVHAEDTGLAFGSLAQRISAPRGRYEREVMDAIAQYAVLWLMGNRYDARIPAEPQDGVYRIVLVETAALERIHGGYVLMGGRMSRRAFARMVGSVSDAIRSA